MIGLIRAKFILLGKWKWSLYKHKALSGLWFFSSSFWIRVWGVRDSDRQSYGVSEAAEAFGGQRSEMRQAEGVARP